MNMKNMVKNAPSDQTQRKNLREMVIDLIISIKDQFKIIMKE